VNTKLPRYPILFTRARNSSFVPSYADISTLQNLTDAFSIENRCGGAKPVCVSRGDKGEPFRREGSSSRQRARRSKKKKKKKKEREEGRISSRSASACMPSEFRVTPFRPLSFSRGRRPLGLLASSPDRFARSEIIRSYFFSSGC